MILLVFTYLTLKTPLLELLFLSLQLEYFYLPENTQDLELELLSQRLLYQQDMLISNLVLLWLIKME